MALVNKDYLIQRVEALGKLTDMDELATEILAEDTMEDAVCILAGVLVNHPSRINAFIALVELCTDDNEIEAKDAEPAAGRSDD